MHIIHDISKKLYEDGQSGISAQLSVQTRANRVARKRAFGRAVTQRFTVVLTINSVSRGIPEGPRDLTMLTTHTLPPSQCHGAALYKIPLMSETLDFNLSRGELIALLHVINRR